MDPQIVISLTCVALAVVYLVRVAWRRWRALDQGGCAGCHGGCPSSPLDLPARGSNRAAGREPLELPSLDTPRR